MKTNHDTLESLNGLLSSGAVAYSSVVPYALHAGDFTSTLKIDLWRGHDLRDLPKQICSLHVVSEGHWEGGRSYCLQLQKATQSYNYEYTDTFGGEANYSWVKRGQVAATPSSVVRRVKALLGLEGVRCTREEYGEMIVLRPIGSCTVVFIS